MPASALAALDLGAVEAARRWRSRTSTGCRTRAGRRRRRRSSISATSSAGGGGSLMVSGREAPARWPIALPDLASRLRAAPVARLEAPDDALLAAVLVKLFADRQLVVGPDLMQFLLTRIDRSFAAAAETVAALDRAGLARHRPITRAAGGRRAAGSGVLSEPEVPEPGVRLLAHRPFVLLFPRAGVLALRGADGDRGAGVAGLRADQQRLLPRAARADAVPAGRCSWSSSRAMRPTATTGSGWCRSARSRRRWRRASCAGGATRAG